MSLIGISVDNRKIDKSVQNIKKVIRLMKSAAKRADQAVTRDLRDILRDEIPVVSGNMWSSVSIEEEGQFVYIVGHDKDKTMTADRQHSYGDIVYYGIRKGYFIVPVNAKALRFVVGGTVVFAKKVFIPPRPGNKFVDRAVLVAERKKIAEKRYKNEFKRIALLRG